MFFSLLYQFLFIHKKIILGECVGFCFNIRSRFHVSGRCLISCFIFIGLIGRTIIETRSINFIPCT
jgi:hypothetical protein